MVNNSDLPEPIIGEDIKLAITSEIAGNVAKILETRSKMLGRAGTYEFRGARDFQVNRGSFVPPPYDLAEVGRAVDIEPYVAQSVRKHREQVLKEGFIIKGPDDEMVAYIKRRLFEISLVSDISTECWFRELVTNVIIYGNGFLVLRRDPLRSSGKPITMYGNYINPIAGIYCADPTTMEVVVDKYGTVRKWKQELPSLNSFDGGSTKYFKPSDVIHITMDKKSGYTFGTPYILPVLDDIRALRKLEELAVILSSKEAFPLYHYKVGTEDRPAMIYEDGSTEVDSATSTVMGLPAQGFVVTSERHEINLISRQGAVMDLSSYLDYFESRVLAGLRLAEIDLGRGGTANRGTASSISKNVQDSAKDYQQVISDILSFKLMIPLLLEGSYDVTEENLVRLDFPMIDQEELRAKETHGLNLYLANSITLTEFRKDFLNKEPMSEEEANDTNRQTDLANELKIIAATPRPASSSGSSKSKDSIRRKVKTLTQPTNQNKTLSTKKRITANDYKDAISICINNLDVEGEIEEDLNDYFTSLTEYCKELMLEQIDSGWSQAVKNNPNADVDEIGIRTVDNFFKNFIRKSYNAVVNPLLETSCDFSEDSGHLEAIKDELLQLVQDQLTTSHRFGFATCARRMGYKYIEITDSANKVIRKVELKNIIYSQLLPRDGEIGISLPQETR